MTRLPGWLSAPAAALCGGAALVVLVSLAWRPPPPLKALHNISVPMDAQVRHSVLAQGRQPGQTRLAFMSNCFFHGAVVNGDRITVVPDSLSLVGRFRRAVGDDVTVFNASVDGTTIVDHLALLAVLRDYDIDAVVIAMAYTEFRRVPLHPLLGNLRDRVVVAGADAADIDDPTSSRGRVLSMDGQRWLTARKYDLYNAVPGLLRWQLWNRHLREHLEPARSERHYSEVYGGEVIPVRHLGLRSRVDQAFRPYLADFVRLAGAGGIDVVLVNQPIRYQEIIAAANPGIFAEHRALLTDTARRHAHVRLVDLDARVAHERLLSDYIHLTYDGLVALSGLLDPLLIEALDLPAP